MQVLSPIKVNPRALKRTLRHVACKSLYIPLLLLSALLSCGCQFNGRMGPRDYENCRVQMEVDHATSRLDVPPDGSRLLLVDGGDFVVTRKADRWWTITFAGGEPIPLGQFADIMGTDDVMSATFSEGFPGGVSGSLIPSYAAKEIAGGGCGAPAARRVAARMLAGTYRLIGVDLQGHHLRMAIDLTDAGRKLLRDALEGKPPTTSEPAMNP
jgi:hypothetical protein